MDRLRIARIAGTTLVVVGIIAAGLGGDLLGVSVVGAGSGALAFVGLVIAGGGWALRRWATPGSRMRHLG
jgi:hypothetical protein